MTAIETRRDNSTWRGAHNLVTKCAIFCIGIMSSFTFVSLSRQVSFQQISLQQI